MEIGRYKKTTPPRMNAITPSADEWKRRRIATEHDNWNSCPAFVPTSRPLLRHLGVPDELRTNTLAQ
jgi:hypothetical protein